MKKNHKSLQRYGGIGLLLMVSGFFLVECTGREEKTPEPPIAITIHGGAGTMRKENMTAEQEEAYRSKLTEALTLGHEILKNGGSSLDAVEQVIILLEDSPLFNAGKGAVFTNAGTVELDASIMEGKTLQAGAVAAVKHAKNPISLARLVMEKSPHVMLAGEGAEAFAQEQGMEAVPNEYFHTPRRWEDLQRQKSEEQQKNASPKSFLPGAIQQDLYSTVGVVALDKSGNLAAGTSTGGRTNKRWGRVGDSPIIGAGTYADNRSCAVSATGHGEYFMRLVLAHRISALMAYRGLSVDEAAEQAIRELGELGGDGGVIAMDKHGNIAMPFNTAGMYRGYVDREGEIWVGIFRE